MGVDHGCSHIFMAEQFLNRVDVGALFQLVRGVTWPQASVAEPLGMAEGGAGRWFADPRSLHGCRHGALKETSSCEIRAP